MLLTSWQAVTVSPWNKPPRNRGNAYADQGQHDQAIRDYTKALEINPKHVVAYFNRGNSYCEKGQYDRAINDFTKAFEINPKYGEAYLNRGIAYAKKGQYDRAISYYDKALEINPKHVMTYNNRGLIYLLKLEKTRRGCADFKKACELGNCRNYNRAKKRGYCR